MLIKNRLVKVFIQHSFPLILVILFFGMGTVLTIAHSIAINSEEQANKQLQNMKMYYEAILDQMDSLNLIFSTNTEMVLRLNQLISKQEYDLQDYRDMRLLRSFLSAPANANPYIDSIYVYFINDERKILTSNEGLVSLSDMEDADWYETFLAHEGITSLIYANQVVLHPDQVSEKNILRIFRIIHDTKGKAIGVIVLNLLKDQMVLELSSALPAEGEFLYIRDQNGILLFTIPQKTNLDFTRNDIQYFTLVSRKYGWVYTFGVYKEDLFHPISVICWYTVTFAVLAMLFGLFLTLKTNKRERLFIRNVLEQLKNAGGHSLQQDPMQSDENVFDYMNYHVLKTFLEQEYFRVKTEAMEYRALQMQINPHFLFNTLDIINWKAVKLSKDKNDVSNMIILLSRILKYSLEVHDKEGVSLDDEIAATQYYLQLQHYRFHDRFAVQWDIDPELKDFHVPQLLFQPILENALNHGFLEDKQLLISIALSRKENLIVFVIHNDGKRISPDIQKKFNKETTDDLVKDSSIGLWNVKRRLQFFYGISACMIIDAPNEIGTKITITIKTS